MHMCNLLKILLTLTKKGMINNTKANSISGLVIGERMNSLTLSQISSCMSNVMQALTTSIMNTYRQHCVNHAFIEGGLPENKIHSSLTLNTLYII